jgi:hypothetical protein
MKHNIYEFFSARTLGGIGDVTKGLPIVKLPNIDLPKIPTIKIDLPKIDPPKIDLPKIDLPKIDPPKIDLPDVGGSPKNLPVVGADKTLLGKASDIIKQGGSDAFEFATKHPRLVTAGLVVSSIGIYAAVNGLTFGQAVGKLETMAASELTEVVKATGSATSQLISEGIAPAVTGIAGATGSAVGNATGNLIGGALDGILDPIAKSLGISKSQLLYIIAGIVIFFVLIWLYRMFNRPRYDDYYTKYFSEANLYNLESLGTSKY